MQKRRHSGSRFGVAAIMGATFLCAALLGFTGCDDSETILSGENKITAFKIDDTSGAIDEVNQTIAIIVPSDTELSEVAPVISVSANASVSPGSETEVDISHPVSYTVTAENGVTRTYTVTVTKEAEVVITYIEVTLLKEDYAYGEELDPKGIVVQGYYSDGTDKIEDAADYEVTGYDPQKSGPQALVVTLNEKTAIFTVNVGAKREISVTIGLPHTNQEPEIFGIPEGGIKLSTSQNNNLPEKIVISAAGKNTTTYPPLDAVYSNVAWFVDGSSLSSGSTDNIITIKASDYTLKIPHYITFVGTKGSGSTSVEYSRTIEFTVER